MCTKDEGKDGSITKNVSEVSYNEGYIDYVVNNYESIGNDTCRNDDNESYKKIYEKYRKMLYFIALKILNDEYLAEDAIHNCFYNIMRANVIEKFDGDDSDELKNYIARVVYNESLKLKLKSSKEYHLTENEENKLMEEKAEYTVEMSVEDAINCRDLIKKIEELPDIYSHALIEHAIRGKSYKDISIQTGVQPETIKKRMHRAKSLLKKKLEAYH